VITPRTTRLWRTPDLEVYQRAIIDLLPCDASAAAACAVIVPSRAAGEELRRTIARAGQADPAAARPIPPLLTRDDFYASLRERVPGAPPPLSAFEREVLLRRSASAAAQSGAEPPFNVRAGLIARMLDLYDELRRHQKTVADFERLMTGALEPGADYDRGAARLLQQTRFLTETFRQFEAAIAATGRADEHRFREYLLSSSSIEHCPSPIEHRPSNLAHRPSPIADRPSPIAHVIVTVADRVADAGGLWTADFDLLTRMAGLDRIDVVTTDGLLEAGFHERIHALLPGIEERRFGTASPPPVLVVPEAAGDSGAPAFVCRDREEELAEAVRAVTSSPDRRLDRTAIVFQRPLPYLYLARQVFADGGIAWQAFDALPLAGEPYAALIDLVFSSAAANYTRAALLGLLRSPHLRFEADGVELDGAALAALNGRLVEKKYLGGIDRLRALAEAGGQGERIAAGAAAELDSAFAGTTASSQIDGVLTFVRSRERLPQPEAPWYGAHMRARSAVLTALETLRDAHAAFDDRPLSIAELSGAVRRWIEGQTFSLRRGDSGVLLLDARAAAYADLDDVRIVGLVDSEWPEPGERSIFYPQSLLAQLGWPSDVDRIRASRVMFQELLRLPRERVTLSTFSLEHDSLVSPSVLLDDVRALGLPIERAAKQEPRARVFAHEALSIDPVDAGAAGGEAREWLQMRMAQPPIEQRRPGWSDPAIPKTYAVSRVETYLKCPFRYFAGHVLRLPEEREEQGWMTPQERGAFMHAVFEEFFESWQSAGKGAITPANAPDAVAAFREVADRRLETLPEGDRALERTFLLGSAAAAGLADRAFAFEMEDAEAAVLERLLEYELNGTFTFDAGGTPRAIPIRAKADRIDLLADGTLRVVDYKLGRAPDRKHALQLPIYGVAAQQALDGRGGRRWTLARAGYVAFKHKGAFVDIGQDLGRAVADGQQRFVAAVEGIERGEFPVRPEDPFLCTWCPYPTVCRKDYVGDE
jgi:RecB family exonuclease